MTSLLDAPLALLAGRQEPAYSWVPPAVSSAGAEAVDLARAAGLVLDPWQELVLSASLGERRDGKWAAFEVAVVMPRQNGKGALLEARELAGLFLLGERMLIHSAHQFDTSLEAFRRLLSLVEDNPDFSRRVKRVARSHGEEGIELVSGQRIRFRTRTKGGGRGFSGDWLGLDEAMFLPESAHGALLPTLSARPNAQVWYTGSAVDQEIHDHGVVFARVRERGLRGGDPALAYFEWSAEGTIDVPDDVVDDPEAWVTANPALGIRITGEHVARERRSMDARTFCVERLGVGDWPDTNPDARDGVDLEAWNRLRDPRSRAVSGLVFAFDVRPDRSAAAIGVVGVRDDDLFHLEVVDHRPGTGWVPARLVELCDTHSPEAVAFVRNSPAAALAGKVTDLPVPVIDVDAAGYAQACGAIVDAVNDGEARHLGTTELTAAARGAVKRPVGDAWTWSRKGSGVDICPFVAVTVALWKARELAAPDLVFEAF